MDTKDTEANIKLSEKFADQPAISKNRWTSDTEEANLKLQDAFYGEGHEQNFAPTYISNNTPAIKITGDEE